MSTSGHIFDYTVIPDTNSLHTRKPQEIVAGGFQAAWAKCLEITQSQLCVPDVVVEELMAQKYFPALDAVENARKNFTTIRDITAWQVPTLPTPEELKRLIRQRFDGWLSQVGAATLKTPLERIDWNKLKNDAIWRLPPFSNDPNTEKGFRDRLILETVCCYCTENPNQKVVFVCNDKLLQSATRDRVPNPTTFAVHETLEGFRSELELLRSKLEKEFVDSVLGEVSKVFFSPDSSQSVYSQLNIREEIELRHKEVLRPPPHIEPTTQAFTLWEPIGSEEEVRIGATTFGQRHGEETYSWKTRLSFVRQYSPQFPVLMTVVITQTRTAEFDVLWKCDISKDIKFSKFELIGIEALPPSFESKMLTFTSTGTTAAEIRGIAAIARPRLDYLQTTPLGSPYPLLNAGQASRIAAHINTGQQTENKKPE